MPLLRISGAVKRNVSEVEIAFPIIPAVRFHRKVPWLSSQRFPTQFPMQKKNKKNIHVGGDLCPHIQMSLTSSISFYWNLNSENFGTHLCNLCHKGIRRTFSQIDGVAQRLKSQLRPPAVVAVGFFSFVSHFSRNAENLFWCCTKRLMFAFDAVDSSAVAHGWGEEPQLWDLVSVSNASALRHCDVKTNRPAEIQSHCEKSISKTFEWNFGFKLSRQLLSLWIYLLINFWEKPYVW